jgi:hypothetical protein
MTEPGTEAPASRARLMASGKRSVSGRYEGHAELMRRPLDPRICNIGHDANVFDRDGTARDALVERFEHLCSAGTLTLVVAGGVRQEAQHPRTPGHVKEVVLPQIFNLRPGLNTEQEAARRAVYALLQGNAQPGRHAADASHLSEAAETGCAYFITEDKRILGKRRELAEILSPSLSIVTLAEFMEIFDGYEAPRRI